ncbi:MAG TPA: hypothetical protein VFZ34_12885 [Blastocatellia bacterium]|nr:hypothetical protein [Blastocatellia bacterium]
MSFDKSLISSAIKYGAIAVAFIFGYEFSGKNIQPYIAIAGWILGFILGLKLHLKHANRS